MRLIDADKLTNDLLKIKEKTHSSGHEVIFSLNDLLSLINGVKTSYDIDKVVEELKNASWEETDISTVIYIDDAIEIVKQGGVTDDVCEWKRRTDDNFLHTSCNYRVGAYSDEFKYCPYCGKKIKEGGVDGEID